MVLAAISISVYALEWFSGAPDSHDILLKFGALVPAMVWDGEIWRLISANFVHIDVSHLAFNLFSLLFLGTFLERYFGRTRMISVFFASGLGAMLTVVSAYSLAGNERDLVAGASAAIFGLVGALFAWLWKDRHPAVRHIRRKQSWVLSCMLAAQFAYDFYMPDISFLGHFSGLIIGWTVAMIIFKPTQEGV